MVKEGAETMPLETVESSVVRMPQDHLVSWGMKAKKGSRW